MSGFSFPPPPPPPPSNTISPNNHHDSAATRGSRGRGRASRSLQGRTPGGVGTHRNDLNNQGGISAIPATDRGFQSTSFFQSSSSAASHYGQTGANFAAPPGHPGFQSPASNVALSRKTAGHKRKLEAFRPQQNEKKPGPPTAPSVPNFGASLPLQQTRRTANPSGKIETDRSSSQRKANVLGLTPADGDHHYSSSEAEVEEDDVDEEAMFAEMGAKLSFEHNGMVVSLSTPAEVAQWRNERRKNFPTRARMSVKLDEKRRIGELRRTLLVHAVKALRHEGLDEHETTQNHSLTVPQSGENVSEVQTEDTNPSGQGPEARNAQVLKTGQDIKDIAEILETRKADSDTIPDLAVKVQGTKACNTDDPIQAAPSEELGEQHNDSLPLIEDAPSHASDSDDGPPEEASSKPTMTMSKTAERVQPCRYFLARGRCRDGEGCRFSHDPQPSDSQQIARESQAKDRASLRDRPPPVRAHVPGRKGIHQALIEQEESDQNKLALQIIKHLGATGFFNN